MRSFGQTYNSSKFRHELARSSVKNVFQHQLLPAAIPVLHRTNLASAYAYVAARVGREQPALSAQLADRFVEHIGAVLQVRHSPPPRATPRGTHAAAYHAGRPAARRLDASARHASEELRIRQAS